MSLPQSLTTIAKIEETDEYLYTYQPLQIEDLIPYLTYNNLLSKTNTNENNSNTLSHPLLTELSSIIKSFCADNNIFLFLPHRLIKNNQYKKIALPTFWCHSNLSDKWFFLSRIKETNKTELTDDEGKEGENFHNENKLLAQSIKYIILEYSFTSSTQLISYKPFKWKLFNNVTYKKYKKENDKYRLEEYQVKYHKAAIGAMACDENDTIFVANSKKIVYFCSTVAKKIDKYCKISGKINRVTSGTKQETICALFSQTNYKQNKEVIFYGVSLRWTKYTDSCDSDQYENVLFHKISISTTLQIELNKVDEKIKTLKKEYQAKIEKFTGTKSMSQREKKRFEKEERKLKSEKDQIIEAEHKCENKYVLKQKQLKELIVAQGVCHWEFCNYEMKNLFYFYDSFPTQHRLFYLHKREKLNGYVLGDKGKGPLKQGRGASGGRYLCCFVKEKNIDNKNKKNGYAFIIGLKGVVKSDDNVLKYRYDVMRYEYKTKDTKFDRIANEYGWFDFDMNFASVDVDGFNGNVRYLGYDEKRDCILYLKCKQLDKDTYWTILYHTTTAIVQHME